MQQGSEEEQLFNEALKICLKNNHVFAAYRLPKSKTYNLIVQKAPEAKNIQFTQDFEELNGFLIYPFSVSDNYKPFIIQSDYFSGQVSNPEQLEKLKELQHPLIQERTDDNLKDISKEAYLLQVEEIIKEIQSGYIEKVVPSRVKLVQGSFYNKIPEIYKTLGDNNNNALVYIFQNREHLWIGATPEPLLQSDNGTVSTVSLAGTRKYCAENENIGKWNSKERLEQEYVTRYISKVLARFNISNVEQTGPYTKKAGNLLHLRTDFRFPTKELKNRLAGFLDELHPTPAVCGMPRKETFSLINRMEQHNREYYTGFLGTVGMKTDLTLFVNLRCMKVLDDKLALFIGGGITADSVPEDEWNETEIKAETLLSAIQQV